MTPLIGFAPDADPTTPGVITDCSNLIPTEKGMAGGPTAVTAVASLAALASSCRGAAVLTDTAGSRRTFAATQTKIYELTGSTWTDVSRAGNYTGSVENRVMFTQFGNAALATNDTEAIGATTGGAFADIATAPKARIIVAAKDFVLAFNTVDGTYGDRPDGWWCSEFQNHAGWTPSVSTQATNGRLVGVPGEITAAATLGPMVAAYKSRGLYLGSYVGAPVVWQWDQIPGDIGCVGPEAVVDVGGAHVFVGEDNIWLFDGTRPVPIATQQVRQWFFNDMSSIYRYRTIVNYDRQNNRVWIHYPSAATSDGTPDRAIVYHLVSKRWGRANRTVECVLNFVQPGLTWDTLSSIAATWDSLPASPWDSQAWQAGGRALAFFDSTHALKALTGSSDESTLTTGDVGDDYAVSYSPNARLRYVKMPTSAACTGYTRNVSGDALDTNGTASLADGKFDVRQSGRWHRHAFSFTGDVETTGYDPSLQPAGSR